MSSVGRKGWVAASGAALLAVILTGCESASTPAASLPKPSFAAPVVASARPMSSQGGAVRVSDGPAVRTGTTPAATGTRTFAAAPPPRAANAAGVPSDWVPTAKANRWHWIIIHHTATPAGALARINASHKGKGWDEAGYHFVVGNGTESRDGQIEVGPRWPKQKYGAHTASAGNEFNLHGIGIVMVGNFDETRPSRKQLESTAKLVAYLMKTYNVPANRVMGHRDAKATDCPGRYTNVAEIRRMATQMLADAGEPIPTAPQLAMGPDGELLHDLAGE